MVRQHPYGSGRCTPAREVRVGYDIPADCGTPTPAARCPRRSLCATARGAKNGRRWDPGCRSVFKNFRLRTVTLAAYFSGEQRWLQLGSTVYRSFNCLLSPLRAAIARGNKRVWRPCPSASDSDLRLPRKRADFSALPTGRVRLRDGLRLQSSSTLILLATPLSPQEFVRSAKFSIPLSGVSISVWRHCQRHRPCGFAVALRRRLLWGSVCFAGTIRFCRGPAWLPGMVIRRRPSAGSGLHD